jgi:tetratricopeptide (TPR) repeat protein
MRLLFPRALAAAAVTLAVTACAGGAGPASGPAGAEEGGRYRVLVPGFAVQGVSQRDADLFANTLRGQIETMATHRSVPERETRALLTRHDPATLPLDVFARQVAPQVNARVIVLGDVQPGGAGLEARTRIVDVTSGDEIELDAVSAADARGLASAVYERFQATMEGLRLAVFCNDYLSSQQYETALETCRRALAIVPGSPSALYGIAGAHLGMEDYAQAYSYYQQLLQVDPLHTDGLLGAGFAASRLERSSDALGYYNRYLEVNPDDVQVRLGVAGEIAQTGDVVSAFRVLEPVIQENLEDIDFQLYLAQVATAAGQRTSERDGAAAAAPFFQTALDAYGRVMAERGDELDVDVLRSVAAVNLALDRTGEAIRIGELATRRAPESATVWAQYGDILRGANRHADAAQAYGRVISLNPDHEGIYVRRAMARLSAGQRQQGLADLEQAAQRGSRDQVAQVIFGLAANDLRASNWSAAATLLETAHGYASGQMRRDIAFQWGVSLYRQGETIARANEARGDVAAARRALGFFQQAIPRLNESGHQQAPAIVAAAQQFIANQEAIIRRGR